MKYIVWDWNGTLLDDVPVCVAVMNGMLERRGLPVLTVERYREIFTFPVEGYYRAAGLDLEREAFPVLAEEYITEYNRRALGCGLYPGAVETLARMEALGYTQLLVSASQRQALAEQVEGCGAGGWFRAVLGIGDYLAVGKAGLAGAYLQEQGAAPEDVLFVGDTLHDWEVAAGLGCRCVLVAGGHQSVERLRQSGAVVVAGIGMLERAISL